MKDRKGRPYRFERCAKCDATVRVYDDALEYLCKECRELIYGKWQPSLNSKAKGAAAD